jgi:hypothetical protein
MDPENTTGTQAPPTEEVIGVRMWTTEDIPMLSEWWAARGMSGPTADLFPPCGVITGKLIGPNQIVPRAAACLHLTADKTGIAFLDWLAVAPYLHPMQAMRAIDVAIMFLQERAKAMDYGLIIALMRDERLARLAEKRHGFTTTNRGVMSQWKAL